MIMPGTRWSMVRLGLEDALNCLKAKYDNQQAIECCWIAGRYALHSLRRGAEHDVRGGGR